MVSAPLSVAGSVGPAGGAAVGAAVGAPGSGGGLRPRGHDARPPAPRGRGGRWSGRRPYDEPGPEPHVLGALGGAARDRGQEEPDGFLALSAHRLVHRREWRIDKLGEGEGVEAGA